VADHVIGHSPKDSYEKQAVLYPESITCEFAKASHRINIFTGVANKEELDMHHKLYDEDDLPYKKTQTVLKNLHDQITVQKRRLSYIERFVHLHIRDSYGSGTQTGLFL